MKNYISFFALFLLGNFIFGQNCNTRLAGGDCIKKGNVELVEQKVHQFRIEVPYSTFTDLIEEFEDDSDYKNEHPNLAIAGFCFLPIIAETSTTPANPNPTRVDYTTVGIRIALTLWDSIFINNRLEAREVRLYDFEKISDAFTLSSEPSRRERTTPNSAIKDLDSGFSLTTLTIADQIQVSTKTREFDLVFLDIETLIDLATSPRFYINRTRNGNGITIERSFINFDPDNQNELKNYRGLLFKPNPEPILPNTTTEGAVAFETGYICPPYWTYPGERDENNPEFDQGFNGENNLLSFGQDTLLGETTLAAFIEQSRLSKRTEIKQVVRPSVDDLLKLLPYLIIILIIILLIIFRLFRYKKTE